MCLMVESSRAHTIGGIYTRSIPIVEYLKERKIFGMYAANQSFNHEGLAFIKLTMLIFFC